MSEPKNRRNAKPLAILWGLSYLLCYIVSSAYLTHELRRGYDPRVMLSSWQLMILCAVLFYFFPLAFAVYRQAKKEQRNKLKILFLVLTWFMGISTIFMLVFTILAVCFPGFFAL